MAGTSGTTSVGVWRKLKLPCSLNVYELVKVYRGKTKLHLPPSISSLPTSFSPLHPESLRVALQAATVKVDFLQTANLHGGDVTRDVAIRDPYFAQHIREMYLKYFYKKDAELMLQK